MINTKFETYKLKRELNRSGIEYEFKRAEENKFGENVGELKVIGKLTGLYHEQNGAIKITTGDTTKTRNKKIPMILCLYEDAARLALQIDDIVEINSKKFKVTGVLNIQEWNLISDISLEVIDDGVRAWFY